MTGAVQQAHSITCDLKSEDLKTFLRAFFPHAPNLRGEERSFEENRSRLVYPFRRSRAKTSLIFCFSLIKKPVLRAFAKGEAKGKDSVANADMKEKKCAVIRK